MERVMARLVLMSLRGLNIGQYDSLHEIRLWTKKVACSADFELSRDVLKPKVRPGRVEHLALNLARQQMFLILTSELDVRFEQLKNPASTCCS